MDDSRRASDGSRGGDVISVITSPKHASGPIAEPPEQAGAQDCSPHSDAAVPRTSRASAGILLPSVKFNVTVTAVHEGSSVVASPITMPKRRVARRSPSPSNVRPVRRPVQSRVRRGPTIGLRATGGRSPSPQPGPPLSPGPRSPTARAAAQLAHSQRALQQASLASLTEPLIVREAPISPKRGSPIQIVTCATECDPSSRRPASSGTSALPAGITRTGSRRREVAVKPLLAVDHDIAEQSPLSLKGRLTWKTPRSPANAVMGGPSPFAKAYLSALDLRPMEGGPPNATSTPLGTMRVGAPLRRPLLSPARQSVLTPQAALGHSPLFGCVAPLPSPANAPRSTAKQLSVFNFSFDDYDEDGDAL